MSSEHFVVRLGIVLSVFLPWVITSSSLLSAEKPVSLDSASTSSPSPSSQNCLHEYRTPFLLVHTDLPPDEAKLAVKNLERTLLHAAKYWGQDPRGQIECYLIQNVDRLADSDLPHRLTRVLVTGVGGVTLPDRSRPGKSGRNVPRILASTRPGVAEHELVHAYCTQTFGFTGPEWYREGMAEMVVHRGNRETGVQWSKEQIDVLRDGQRITVEEILAAGQPGNRILVSLNAMLTNPKNHNRHIPISDWQPQDAANVTSARHEYLRCWSLCYLLLNNPNYAPRFRTLGHNFVTNKEGDFASVFSPMQKEIAFEYSFFLQNICAGFRVDLCSWHWTKRFQALGPSDSVAVRVTASQGYQPSGISVVKGQRYRYGAEGTWSICQKEGPTGANGRDDHGGRLVAVVMADYKLGEPFALGVDGIFEAPTSGNLYLRCHDAWNALQDNAGFTLVNLRTAE